MSTGWFILGTLVGAGGLYLVQQQKGAMPRLPSAAAPTAGPFKRVNQFPEGTSYKSSIKAKFSDLKTVFGPPKRFDDMDYPDTYNEWVFQGPGGLFTIYDTDDGGDGAANPNKVYQWRIGGSGSSTKFKAWVAERLGGYQRLVAASNALEKRLR
jgi:hypothetical protein